MQRRLEDAIAAKQDDIARLQARQVVSEKAVQLSAAQVTELQGALQDQAQSLESSEEAREAVQVTAGADTNGWTAVTFWNSRRCM